MSLKKWFREDWVDIGAPKKGADLKSVGVAQLKVVNANTPNVSPLLKLVV